MNFGKLVFAQVTQHLPLTTFRRCLKRYGGAHKVKSFSCLDQYLEMFHSASFHVLSLLNILQEPLILKFNPYSFFSRASVG